MDEYIERGAFIEAVKDIPMWGSVAAMLADSIPAADVAPVVHARWIHSRYEDCSEQFELVKCSQCNHEAYAMAFYVRGGNYCPACGAKMDGGADNDREALLLRIDCHGTNKFGMIDEDIRAFVKAQPAADVAPVVRCEDCVHWDDDPDTYGADYGPKGKCMKSFETMCADDFCSYGERRDKP